MKIHSVDSESESDDEPLLKKPKKPASRRNSMLVGSESSETKNNLNSRRSRRTGDSLPLDSVVLYELLEDIGKHSESWPFLSPVSIREVPDYYDIIAYPMDFARIKSKLNMGEYRINEEVLKDIQQIFKNCDTYNVEGNEIYT